MTQEQKAQAYDEVREKIALRFGSNVAEEVFSEFEMSEDERIRKWLYGYFRSLFATWIHPDITCDEILTWLEKQGKQKPEKKELKKIEQTPTENKGMNIDEESMTPFQKKVFCIIDTAIEEEQGLKQVCDELLDLASNEIEQKPDWSEEDEDDLNNIIWLCNNCIRKRELTWAPSQATRIKSLIERIKDIVFVQPKHELGEEDEKKNR